MNAFLSQIFAFGFNFAPRGWASCYGQILPINQNQSLYSLLGTTFGGDGRTSFALPDLRGRIPVHPGENGIQLGTRTGIESVALTTAEIPPHSHSVQVSNNAPGHPAVGGLIGQGLKVFEVPPIPVANKVALNRGTIANTGGGIAHENIPPVQVLNYCICIAGLFPSRS